MIIFSAFRQNFLLPLFLFCPFWASSQSHDNIWSFGVKKTSWEGDWDNSVLNFNSFPPTANLDSLHNFTIGICGTTISDANGSLQFYTNGFTIANSEHDLMENGDSLNLSEDYSLLYPTGSRMPQGVVCIPDPSNTQQYYLLHTNADEVWASLEYAFYGSHLFYSKIDMTQNGGLGKVIDKNHLLIEDSLTAGALTAVKHANGRDWWVLVFKFSSKKYYRILISENGIEVIDQQQIDVPLYKGQFGQFVFSPDGSKFAAVSTTWDLQQRHWIEVFDFDRCLGLLSNRERVYCSKRYNYNGSQISDHAQGLSFSPNSRFLYLSFFKKAYQVDTWASSMQESLFLIAEYDNYQIFPGPNSYPFSTFFGLAQLGPDGRIYTNTSHPTPYFHVTEQPNNRWHLSKFIQRGLELPGYNNGHIPNHPNYRLGPLEGSGCDTLGLEKAVSILAHPYPFEACVGGEAHFEATAFGTGRSYQWQQSLDGGGAWEDIAEGPHFTQATTEYLLLHDIPASFAGRQFRCVVTGNISTETSRPATLTLVSELPTANFSYVQDKDSLHFQNLSTGHEYFEWHLGNGDSTLLEAPSLLYAHAGSYPVELIATNACGQDTLTQVIEIPAYEVNFTADRTHGCPPLTVNYTSDVPYRTKTQKYLTPGSSVPVAWVNSGKHTVTYNAVGSYNATLIGYTPMNAEIDTLAKPNYITLVPGTNPVADISAQQQGSTVELGTAPIPAATYTWLLSNGDTLSGQNVSYDFGSDGIYTVVLQTANQCGAALDTLTLVVGDLGAAFAHGPTVGCGPLQVQFLNTSPFQPDSVTWLFPGTATPNTGEDSPTVAFTTSGTYSATLIAFFNGFSDTITQQLQVEILADECPIPQVFTQVDGLEVTAWADCPIGTALVWDMGDGTVIASGAVSYQYPDTGSYAITLTATGQCGGSYLATATVLVTGPSATSRQADTSGPFAVFPNPASGQVFFATKAPLTGAVRIRLRSATGLPVAEREEGQWNGTAALPLSGLPSGMYFYEIEMDGAAVQQGKLVVGR